MTSAELYLRLLSYVRPYWRAFAVSMLGMAVVSALIALPSLYAASRVPAMERWLRLASGAASLAFGLFLAHQIGVTDGLFGANPQWDPH